MTRRAILVGAFAVVCSFAASESYAQATASSGTLGQRAYKAVCMGCHSVEPGVTKIGPTLFGTLGRKAGSPTGSEALRQSGLVWDRATLDLYLRDPAKFVPGTTMEVRMEDVEVRQAVIDFIATLK